jgi:hypothetical protein
MKRTTAYFALLFSFLQDALKLRTLDWAVKSGDVKTQDFFYPIGGVASSAQGTTLAWKYFRDVRTLR